MNTERKIRDQQNQDRALEQKNRIRRQDPIADRMGGRVYTPSDIRAVERERMRAKRG